MNKSQIWAILECCLLISQEKTETELIEDYHFLPAIPKSANQLYLFFKTFELVGNPFDNLTKRECPTAESFEIPFNKIKPGDFK